MFHYVSFFLDIGPLEKFLGGGVIYSVLMSASKVEIWIRNVNPL